MTGAALAPAVAAVAAAAAAAGLRRIVAARVRVPRPEGRGAGIVARSGWGGRIGGRLERSGVPLAPGAFLALAAAAAVIAGGVAVVLGLPVLAPAAAGGVVLGARSLLISADERYQRRVAAQLPAVAQHLAAGLGAGLSLRQAIVRAARDAPRPAADELAIVAGDLRLGARVDEALERLAERLSGADARIMVAAIVVQRRTGGNLARALAELAQRLEERGALARELRGATAQARLTAWLVAALPAVGGIVVEVAAPGTLGRTLGSGVGLALILVAAGLQVAGVLAVRRIARVEP
jgi:tight adherence protein B